MANGMIGRIKWTVPVNKGLLKNNKNVLNAAGINRINQVSYEGHSTFWFQDNYFSLDWESRAFQMNIKALFRTFCWFLKKKQYALCPDYRLVSNKHYPLAYQKVNKRPGRQIESLRYTL